MFSKLDAKSGFWLHERSRNLTTFISPQGRFRFNQLPFGISSTPEFFQHEMSNILQDIEGVICYMDNVLIYGSDALEHDHRVHKVLKRLSEAGVTLNNKCEFSVSTLKIFGPYYFCQWH